jgi:hypothetical protein
MRSCKEFWQNLRKQGRDSGCHHFAIEDVVAPSKAVSGIIGKGIFLPEMFMPHSGLLLQLS